jgi:hypothetical protein
VSVRHSKEELQAFAATKETRQLWARDVETDGIVYLEEGRADDFRDGCSSGRYICPIEGCESPAYGAVGGLRKRHHFRHRHIAATAHAPESWLHETGKRWLGQELARRYPEARVFIDTKAIDGGQRPDVLLEFRDDRRFAFEVQYSPITISDWRRRHSGYADEGIADVWLFGNVPPHLRFTRLKDDEGAITLGDLHQAMAEEGLAIHFIAPDIRSIGTALVHSGRYMIEPRNCELGIDPLEDCEIEGDAFVTPSDRREQTAIEEEAEREKEREARRLERLKEIELEEKRQAEREVWKEKAKARSEARRLNEREEWQAEGAARFLSLVGLTEMPAIISEHSPADHCIDGYHERWHAEFYWQHLREIGASFSYSDAAKRFWDAQPKGKKWVNRALTGYLFALKRAGFVHFESIDAWIEGSIVVIANFSEPPTRELANAAGEASFATLDGCLALVNGHGEVVRLLRPLVEGDDYPSMEVLTHEIQESEREWLRKQGYLPPREVGEGAPCCVLVSLPHRLIEVHMFERLDSPRFRQELQRIADEKPGTYRVNLWLYAEPGIQLKPGRVLSVARIDGADEDELHELIESAVARSLAPRDMQTAPARAPTPVG